MRKPLMLAALVPATAMAGILPATAQASGTVHSSAVVTRTTPGAYPLHAVRSSSVRCAGTLGYRAYAKAGKTVVGELDVYTSTAAGGTVIACFRHAGATTHKWLPTSVALVTAKTATSKAGVAVLATGNFTSWAGPVAIAGVKGHCVQATGAVTYQGKKVTIAMPAVCTH